MLILFEHASGYAIFKVSGADVVSQMVQDAVPDFTQFCQLVSLLAFQPFKTAANALDNINNISEGITNLTCTCSFTSQTHFFSCFDDLKAKGK